MMNCKAVSLCHKSNISYCLEQCDSLLYIYDSYVWFYSFCTITDSGILEVIKQEKRLAAQYSYFRYVSSDTVSMTMNYIKGRVPFKFGVNGSYIIRRWPLFSKMTRSFRKFFLLRCPISCHVLTHLILWSGTFQIYSAFLILIRGFLWAVKTVS